MDSLLLEVAIGLALMFLVAATLASALNEMVTRSLNMRSKTLWARLRELMEKKGSATESLGYPFLLQGIASKRPIHDELPGGGVGRLGTLANTGSIHALDYVRAGKESKVWKIPGEVFASALLELATAKEGGEDLVLQERIDNLADDYPGTPLGSFLKSTGVQLATDADRFVDGAGRWFDGQMSVLSATYRRNVRLALAGIGLVIAVGFNLNAITVAQELAQNAAMRQAVGVVATGVAAGAFDECREKNGEEAYTCAAEQVALFADAGVLVPFQDGYSTDLRKAWSGDEKPVAVTLLGILLTTGAVAFGGPFWFDFLRYLSGFRRART